MPMYGVTHQAVYNRMHQVGNLVGVGHGDVPLCRLHQIIANDLSMQARQALFIWLEQTNLVPSSTVVQQRSDYINRGDLILNAVIHQQDPALQISSRELQQQLRHQTDGLSVEQARRLFSQSIKNTRLCKQQQVLLTQPYTEDVGTDNAKFALANAFGLAADYYHKLEGMLLTRFNTNLFSRDGSHFMKIRQPKVQSEYPAVSIRQSVPVNTRDSVLAPVTVNELRQVIWSDLSPEARDVLSQWLARIGNLAEHRASQRGVSAADWSDPLRRIISAQQNQHLLRQELNALLLPQMRSRISKVSSDELRVILTKSRKDAEVCWQYQQVLVRQAEQEQNVDAPEDFEANTGQTSAQKLLASVFGMAKEYHLQVAAIAQTKLTSLFPDSEPRQTGAAVKAGQYPLPPLSSSRKLKNPPPYPAGSRRVRQQPDASNIVRPAQPEKGNRAESHWGLRTPIPPKMNRQVMPVFTRSIAHSQAPEPNLPKTDAELAAWFKGPAHLYASRENLSGSSTQKNADEQQKQEKGLAQRVKNFFTRNK